MKKITILATALFILFGFTAVNAESSVRVVIDGEEVMFSDSVPFVDENSRTLVPLRAMGEAMGLTVNWDPEQREAVFSREYTWDDSPLYSDYDYDGENDTYLGLEKVIFKIGDNQATYEESWYDKGTSPNVNAPSSGGIGIISMDTVAIIKDSRTYAPARYLAEAFRYDVGWVNETRTVMLNYLYSVHELGIHIEQVASWEDNQSWMFTVDEESDIQAVDILSITIDSEDSTYSILTEDDQNAIYGIGADFGKYLNGFTVEKELNVNTYYEYRVKFLVTTKDGTQILGFVDIGLYYDGGQGGYI